jgi:hypothetical protein
MALAGRKANVKITSSTSVTSTGEAASLAADGLSVQVDASSARHWDPASTGYPILYLNSTAVSSTAYTVNYVQGKAEFSSTQSTGTYTLDVDYLTASAVAGGREWNLNATNDMFEVTEFGSSGWKQFLPNMSGATVTVGRYWSDSNFYDLLNNDNQKFLLELIVSLTAGWKYEGYGYVTNDAITTPTDAIVEESVDFTVDGQLYFTT